MDGFKHRFVGVRIILLGDFNVRMGSSQTNFSQVCNTPDGVGPPYFCLLVILLNRHERHVFSG